MISNSGTASSTDAPPVTDPNAAQTIDANFLASTATLYNATIAPGSVTIEGAFLASTAILYEGELVSGGLDIPGVDLLWMTSRGSRIEYVTEGDRTGWSANETAVDWVGEPDATHWRSSERDRLNWIMKT